MIHPTADVRGVHSDLPGGADSIGVKNHGVATDYNGGAEMQSV